MNRATLIRETLELRARALRERDEVSGPGFSRGSEYHKLAVRERLRAAKAAIDHTERLLTKYSVAYAGPRRPDVVPLAMAWKLDALEAYRAGATMKEIGEGLGVSRTRISQVIGQAAAYCTKREGRERRKAP